eukprot:3624687-Lingulodinium_polyedra.AAC.1
MQSRAGSTCAGLVAAACCAACSRCSASVAIPCARRSRASRAVPFRCCGRRPTASACRLGARCPGNCMSDAQARFQERNGFWREA